jgi:Sugar (and other) transporter
VNILELRTAKNRLDMRSEDRVDVGLVNLLATFLGNDKLGRKTLLLIGAIGMTIARAGIFYTHVHQQLLVWLLVCFIIFLPSPGTRSSRATSRRCPSLVRLKGQSVGSSSHWITNALNAGVFPFIADRSQAAPFVFYPEIKASSLEQIQAQFGIYSRYQMASSAFQAWKKNPDGRGHANLAPDRRLALRDDTHPQPPLHDRARRSRSLHPASIERCARSRAGTTKVVLSSRP